MHTSTILVFSLMTINAHAAVTGSRALQLWRRQGVALPTGSVCNTECAGVSPALTSCAEAQATLTAAPTGPVTSCSCDPTVLSAFQTCFNCAVANGLDSAAQAQTGLQDMEAQCGSSSSLPSITAVAPAGGSAAASGATSAPAASGAPGASGATPAASGATPGASGATPAANGASSGAPSASAGAPTASNGAPAPAKSANPNGAESSRVGKSIFAITLLAMACSVL